MDHSVDALYVQIKALIGNLEDKLDRLDREVMPTEERLYLTGRVEAAWNALCRRRMTRRGPYNRRSERHSVLAGGR